MNVIWHKVWSDLWHNKVRTLLATLSIAAGVFAVGAIFGMVDLLLSGMNEAHAAVFPSHINMFLQERIKRDTAIRLKSIEGLEDIEVMNSLSVRYKLNPEDEWQAGILEMREDYEVQKYDLWQLKAGQWPKNKGLAIERLSSQHFGIGLGDEVIFELDKSDRALPIIGKIRHPFVQPPAFGADAVFLSDAQGLERFNVLPGEYSNIRARVSPYSPDLAREVASEMKRRLAKENIGVAITLFQDPEEHWGRPLMQGFNLVLQILAVVSLFMSVILVVNTLTALITQQVGQIGMIRAIGGSTGVIVKIYLTGVVVYGILALFIALPLGAGLAFSMSQYFLNIFNIDYDAFQVSYQALIYQAIAALIVPLLAALWPVLSGANMSVRQAIATYGLGSDRFGRSWLDRRVEQVGQRFLASSYAAALGNMFRRKGRLLLTQLVLVVAGSTFLGVMSLSTSLTFSLSNDISRRNFDIRLGFTDEQRIDRVLKLAYAVAGVEEAEVWFIQPASVLRAGQITKEAGVGSEINGVPDGNMVRPLILAGRWLQPDDNRTIVISQKLAADNQIKVGDRLTLDLGELGDDDWTVVGIYQVFLRGGFDTDPIYAPQKALFSATKQYNQGSWLLVRTGSPHPDDVRAVSNRLKNLYESRHMDVNVFASGITPDDVRDAESLFNVVVSMLLFVAVIVALVGAIGLMGSLSISVVERTREIGVMRAIGARTGAIMGMFVMEGVLQGLMSWALSVPISFVFGKPLAGALGQAMFATDLDYQYNFAAVVIWLVIILVVSTLASALPARRAAQISVRESLVYA